MDRPKHHSVMNVKESPGRAPRHKGFDFDSLQPGSSFHLCEPTRSWDAIPDAALSEIFTSCEAPGHAASSEVHSNLLRSHYSVSLGVSGTGSCCR